MQQVPHWADTREVDILKAIAEGVGGSRPISTVKPGPKPKTPAAS